MSDPVRMLKVSLLTLWVFVILVLSIIPVSSISTESYILFPNADKVVHGIMYFTLQVLAMWNISHRLNIKLTIQIFILVALYGFTIEYIQGKYLTDRFYEFFDLIANITGALTGTIFFNRIKT